MDTKEKLAKLILIEIEAVQSASGTTNVLVLVNEILRDAKQLAIEIVDDTEDKAA